MLAKDETFGWMLTKSSSLGMGFVFSHDGALFQQARDFVAAGTGQVEEDAQQICALVPHGQPLCRRRGGELPACGSASHLPISQPNVMKKIPVKAA